METVVLVIHMFIALALIGVILLQPSTDGGGLTASSSSMSGFMTPRGSANLLTRTTIILALGFMMTSLALVALSGLHKQNRSILDQISSEPAATDAPAVPVKSDVKPTPVKPNVPSVPVEK